MHSRALALGGSALALLASFADAHCHAGCYGHGTCGPLDQCVCFPGYMGASCRLRACPFGTAWTDPTVGDLNHDGEVDPSTSVHVEWTNAKVSEVWQGTEDEEAHFSAECSGRGFCRRDVGECECYPGFTGAACQRAECSDDCSGHGVCRTAREIAAGALNKRRVSSVGGDIQESGVTTPFVYNLWDADMTQACVCDPGWTGHNCAKRQCPRGDDPLTTGKRYCGGLPCHYSVQEFDLLGTGEHTLTFRFEDWTGRTHESSMIIDTQSAAPGLMTDDEAEVSLADKDSAAGLIMTHLRNEFPSDLFSRIEVRSTGGVLTSGYTDGVANTGGRNRYQITFVGLPGKQSLLQLVGDSVDDTVPQPVTYATSADNAHHADPNGEAYDMVGSMEEIECSGRGTCDSATGICGCFAGYYGQACEFQNALVM